MGHPTYVYVLLIALMLVLAFIGFRIMAERRDGAIRRGSRKKKLRR